MEKSSPPSDKNASMESIIGLGEASFRKNHFPALQKKIADLEALNSKYRALIQTIPDILLTESKGELSVFSSVLNSQLVSAMLEDGQVQRTLQEIAKTAGQFKRLAAQHFTFTFKGKPGHYEARANHTQSGETLIIIRDMTSEVHSQQKLKEMATRDGITRLNNRSYFEECLFRYNGKPSHQFCLILLDIDGLKIINDTLGHIAGDETLISFAGILKTVFTEAACIARVGGDEFGILLTGLSHAHVEGLLKKMNAAIEKHNNTHTLLMLSVSFGYSYMNSDSIDLNLMYREADNKMYQHKLLKENSNRSSIVKALMSALEAKDFITEGHAQRMEHLAALMGQTLGLPQDRVDRIKLLARFHDIGKVGIPDSILMKQGRLTDSEWEIMKSHSSIGKRIASSSPELYDIAELILLHHERWDGTGYPLGLIGDAIPVECRILSIVDAFDAMTNDRPYRAAMSEDAAMAELIAWSGTQFDANLVSLFVDIAGQDILSNDLG